MVNEGGREGNIIVGNQEGGRSGSGIVVLGRVGDTVTLAVVNEGGGEKGSGSESCSLGGGGGGAVGHPWERGEVVKAGRWKGADRTSEQVNKLNILPRFLFMV